jgi:hypothetical protein
MPTLSKFHRLLALPLALLLCAVTAFAAGTVSGTVTNKTTGKPAGGDDVVLLRLQQGMQEAGHTKTDAKGNFKIDVVDDGLHLLRVTHDKATYFQPIQDTTQPVAIDVYSSASKVSGVATEAEIIRMETQPGDKNLKITENFFVKNDSAPPMTQFSDRPFDFYLPTGANVQGSAALAPGGMPVQAAPVPIQGEAGHYTFVFPIRPGETRFQIQYTLPYDGSLKFSPRLTTPTDTIAIILPKSMKFVAGTSVGFAAMPDDVDGQTYVLRSAQPSQPLDFTVSGTGQLPRDTAATQQAAAADSTNSSTTAAAPAGGDLSPSEASARQRADTRPGIGLNNPVDSDAELEPWSKYKWWIIGLLGVALAAGGGFMMRTGPAPLTSAAPAPAPTWPPVSPLAVAAPAAPATPGPNALLQALKDELFQLETERLSGTLTEAQYAEHKAALEIVLRRALARTTPTHEVEPAAVDA